MAHDKIIIGGEMFAVASRHKRKGDAIAHANLTSRSGLFKDVKVVESRGEHVVGVRGVARDPTTLTPQGLRQELGLPKTVTYNRRTGRIY
jgi:hypothetical protein